MAKMVIEEVNEKKGRTIRKKYEEEKVRKGKRNERQKNEKE